MSLSWGSPTSLARSRYCASLVRPLLTLSTAHFRVASEMQINTRQIYFSKLGKVAFKHEEKKQLPPMLQIETCPSSHLNSFRGVWNWKVADFGAAFKWTGSEKQHYLWVSLCWWPLLKDSFKRHDSDLKRCPLPARKGGVARRVEVTEPRNRTQHFHLISSISPFLLVGFLTILKDNACQ